MAPTPGNSKTPEKRIFFEPGSFSLSEKSKQTGVTVPNAGPSYTMWAVKYKKRVKTPL